MNNADRIRRLLARDRKFEHVPEALIVRTARQASPKASDTELLSSVAEGCALQAGQYRKGGWLHRAAALEKLAFRLQQVASMEMAREAQ